MAHPWPESDPALLAPVDEHEELRAVVRQLLAKHADHERVRAVADSETGWSPRALGPAQRRARDRWPRGDRGRWAGRASGSASSRSCSRSRGAALLPEPVLASAVIGCRALVEADDPDSVTDLRDPALSRALRPRRRPCDGDVRATHGDDGWTVSGVAERVLQADAAGHLVVAARTPRGNGAGARRPGPRRDVGRWRSPTSPGDRRTSTSRTRPPRCSSERRGATGWSTSSTGWPGSPSPRSMPA